MHYGFNEYNVKIKITPKAVNNKKMLQMQLINNIWNIFKTKGYNKGSESIKIEDFESQKIIAKDENTNTTKTFKWNSTENEFVPVIYLKDIGVTVTDGVPNFEELKAYCSNLFDNEIHKEMRPDLYVTKSV